MKWQVKKLSECFSLKSGDFLSAKSMNTDGPYPVFGGNGFINTHDKYNLSGDNVIIGRVGALCGNVRNIEGDIWLTDNAFKVTNYKFDFDNSFLTYLLNYKNLRAFAKQTAQPVISNASLNEVTLEFPPLPEQKRIVGILDEVFRAVAQAKENAEKNLANAKALFESYLQNIFANPGKDWEEKKLGEVCNFFNGYAFKSGDAVASSNTQLVRMGNLYQNELDLERRAVFYPDSFATEYSAFLLNEGDLIISLTGTTGKQDYGYTVQVPATDRVLLVNQRIAKIEILDEKNTNRDFLLHLLLSKIFLDKLYRTANGTRQANLSTVSMKQILVSMPKPKEQQSIVTKLDTLSAETKKLEAIYTQKLTALEELKKSVLKQAFEGRL